MRDLLNRLFAVLFLTLALGVLFIGVKLGA
jgi:hypothetical protein